MKSGKEISQEVFERIDAFLSNRMNAAEKAEMERDMAADSDLYSEVKLQKELKRAVELGALKEVLHSIDDQNRQRTSTPSDAQPRRYWWAMAASFVALVGMGIWILGKPEAKHERIFAEYAYTDPGLPVPMSTTDQYAFYDAMVDYKNELYPRAIDKWKELLSTKPANDTLLFYIASSYFNEGHFNSAISYFEKVADHPESVFRARSQFYLALAWLQTKDDHRIHELVSRSDSLYRNEIESISNKLNTK